jgi:hypothetical protein
MKLKPLAALPHLHLLPFGKAARHDRFNPVPSCAARRKQK